MEHCDDLGVIQSGALGDQDIFHVSAVTESVDSSGNVNLALNKAELVRAFEESCARAEGSFTEFMTEAKAQANIGATEVFPAARAFNEANVDNPFSQRILRIRVCIKVFRWLRIYIYWKI